RRRGQLFRMGAGPAAVVLGGRGGDAAGIPDPRTRFRPDAFARQGRQHHPSHRGDGDRRGEGPRCQEHKKSLSVITGLHHFVIVTSDSEAGASAYQMLLGRAPSWRYKGEGIARALFTLDNTTLELVAPDGENEGAGRIRAVLAEQGEGLASLCFRTL